jgi:hypothetical protein
MEREAEKAPKEEPQLNPQGIEEVVADKGYHSGSTVQAIAEVPARSYIPEPQRKPRKWAGKADEQKAVYGNRGRLRGIYGRRHLKKRGELIERSFAHCYETGGMRRLHLRGRENVLKRQLIHVGAFNLCPILRRNLGAGTPRELHYRVGNGRPAISASRGCSTTQKPQNQVSARPAFPPPNFGGFRHGLPARSEAVLQSSVDRGVPVVARHFR